MLLITCILSGCDYLESIKGIGFKKAFKLVNEFGNDLPLILRRIRREGKYMVPVDYEANFEKALLTFKFQIVFSPDKNELIHLNDPETHPLGELLSKHDSTDFLGQKIDKELAVSICRGDIDPITREKYKEIVASSTMPAQMRVYSRKHVPRKKEKVQKQIGNGSGLLDYFSQKSKSQESNGTLTGSC